MAKKTHNLNTDNQDSEAAFGILALLILFIAFVWGNPDKKSQVISPKLKDMLSDEENSNALMKAIEDMKSSSSSDKPQEFMMDGKKYKIKRSSREFVS